MSCLQLLCTGAEVPEPVVTAGEDSEDLLMLNNTLTEAMLVVFHVSNGSALGSGFSATYSGAHQGLASTTDCILLSPCERFNSTCQSAAHVHYPFSVAASLHHECEGSLQAAGGHRFLL